MMVLWSCLLTLKPHKTPQENVPTRATSSVSAGIRNGQSDAPRCATPSELSTPRKAQKISEPRSPLLSPLKRHFSNDHISTRTLSLPLRQGGRKQNLFHLKKNKQLTGFEKRLMIDVKKCIFNRTKHQYVVSKI